LIFDHGLAGHSTELQSKTMAVQAAPRLPTGYTRVAKLTASYPLRLTITLTPRDPSKLAEFDRFVSDPDSSLFRHFVATPQFVSNFAPNASTLDRIRSYIRRLGLPSATVSSNHLSLTVTAMATKVETAFQTPIVIFRLRDGASVYANTKAVQLPRAIAPDVQSVLGLDDLTDVSQEAVTQLGAGTGSAWTNQADLVANRATTKGGVKGGCLTTYPADTIGLTASQVAGAYGFSNLYQEGDLGAGQTVAVVSFGPIKASDIAEYECHLALETFPTTTTPNCIAVDQSFSAQLHPPQPTTCVTNDPTFPRPPIDEESTTDVEQVVSYAPEASVDVYEVPEQDYDSTSSGQLAPSTCHYYLGDPCTGYVSSSWIYDAYSAIVNNPSVDVMTESYGLFEATACASTISIAALNPSETAFCSAESDLFAQAAAEGMTILGDSGDLGPNTIEEPAADYGVTGVGGTVTSTVPPPLGPPPTEEIWPASSGGSATQWPMPAWQCPLANGTASPCTSSSRKVPDVSALADGPGYELFCTIDFESSYDAGTASTSNKPTACGPGPNSGWVALAGTSLSTPLWAAFIALTDSQCGRVGFINPALYQIAQDGIGFNTIGGSYTTQSGLGSPIGAELSAALCALNTGNRGTQLQSEQQTTLYVSNQGKDLGNDCMAISSPCLTVSRAVSVIQGDVVAGLTDPSGYTISLGMGAIIDNVSIPGGLPNLTITGEAGPYHSIICAGTGSNAPVITINRGARVMLDNLIIICGSIHTHATVSGGGGILNFGTATLISDAIGGNKVVDTSVSTLSSSDGGGIDNIGTMKLVNVSVVNNSIQDHAGEGGAGGGVANRVGGELSVVNSVIVGNTANVQGGGIQNDGVAQLDDDTVSSNVVHQHGGGMSNRGLASLINDSFSDNKAATGGAVANFGTMTMTASSLAFDLGRKGTEIFSSSRLQLAASIIGSGTVAGRVCIDGGHTIVDEGYNFSRDASCGLSAATSHVNIDPKLGPLANNGSGIAPLTMMPASSSPVSVFGIPDPTVASDGVQLCPGWDERGLPSPIGAPLPYLTCWAGALQP
jgi:Pro-kumamolisin, activation domain